MHVRDLVKSKAVALHRALRRFGLSRHAAAAVEFALILPLMITLYAGASEMSDAIMTRRKVESIARTLVDLTSQQPTSTSNATSSTPAPSFAATASTLSTIMSAAGALIAPAPTKNLLMTITAVDVKNNLLGLCCEARVRWTYTQGGTLRPCGVPLSPAAPDTNPSPGTISSAMIPQVITLPQPQAALIVDVAYSYTPIFSNKWLSFLTGWNRTVYSLPRGAGQVIATGTLTSGTQTGVICY